MILFMDGFDHYNNIGQQWDIGEGGFVAPGRFGVGQCFSQSGGGNSIVKILSGNYATLYAGRGRRTGGGLQAGETLFAFRDGSTNQCEVRVAALGAVQVTRNGTVLATSAIGVISVAGAVWQHVGFKATIHPTAGTYDVWVDGVNVLSGTGANTRATANSYANVVGAYGVNNQCYIDDFYVGDTSGPAPNNDYLGDCRINTLYPTGAGNHTDFTHSTGATNWGTVDETPPNGDTDYNYSPTVGAIDTFTHTQLSSGAGNVMAVQACLYVSKDDAGLKKVAPVFRHAATDAVGADIVVASGYAYGFQLFGTNPANGGAAWTISDVNADEFGYKVTA